jgi:(p)ppGpp synthase/HD superfamily hydrolase
MTLNTIQAERASRMAFIRNPDGSVLEAFDRELSNLANINDISKAWGYAQTLDYHHPGQSKEAYLAHPLRVATLCIQLVNPLSINGVITSLLHNIQELSDIEESAISNVVGRNIASAITVLTVNRDLQWDDNYKDIYYKKICSASLFVQQVKILDKLDNLFLLCLNPSDDIREKYLREIEKWLLPMAENAMPTLSNYLHELIINNRAIGHMPLDLIETKVN